MQSQEFEKAASLRDMEQRLREKLEDTKRQWKEATRKRKLRSDSRRYCKCRFYVDSYTGF